MDALRFKKSAPWYPEKSPENKMKLALLSLPLFCCTLGFAQNQDLFDKAPPEVDEALRSRVSVFYQAHVSGRYRDALKVVADDAMDDFLGGSRDSFKACEISKINYAENFTKATVTTACKGEYRWHGSNMPVTIPTLSTWKLVNGEWFWYHIKSDVTETPWGISRATPENSTGPAKMPSIPADPVAAAENILRMVSIDKTELRLKGYEASKGEVKVTNNMPGSVTVSVDKMPFAGAYAKIDHPELESKGTATITFSYDPNDPSIKCSECTLKVALPTVIANVRVAPTAQVFPIKITFAVPPELEKLLPKTGK